MITKWLTSVVSFFKKLFKKDEATDDKNCNETNNPVEDSSIDTTPEEAPEDEVVCSSCNHKQYPNLCVSCDPGHGSDTPGKCSPYVSSKDRLPALYFREYQFSREIANMLKEELAKYGVEVYITVTEEKDVSLTTRYQRANKFKEQHPDKKHVFVSIHANAAGNGQWMNARGWSVYTTKGQNNSDKLATCLYEAAEEILTPLGQKLRKDMSDGDPDYESNFTVIYGANMPAVLTENFFQDNVDDVKFLISDEGKKAIVDIHRKGILDYAEKYLDM